MEELLGTNYEAILGASGISITFITAMAFNWLKKKSIGTAVLNVTSFFTKDMTQTERDEFSTIIKSVGSRKSLKVLDNLVNQLDKFDIGMIQDAMTIISAIVTSMINNGAFDDNEQFKLVLQTIVDKYTNV